MGTLDEVASATEPDTTTTGDTMLRRLAFAVLAASCLVPIPGNAQGPALTAREIATLDTWVEDAVLLPSGQAIVYVRGDSIVAYHLATKQSTLIARGMEYGFTMSPAGNRLAFGSMSADGQRLLVWSVPIDPQIGAPTGEPRPVSQSEGGYPSFSPDGRTIAFGIYGEAGTGILALVPAEGGAERIVATVPSTLWSITWSQDGQWVDVVSGVSRDSLRTVERVPLAGGPATTRFTVRPPFQVFEGQLEGVIAFYRADATSVARGELSYLTADGQRGAAQIPAGARLRSPLSSRVLMGRTTSPPATAHLLSVFDGTVRDLGVADVQPSSFKYSPDGSHLAMVTASGTPAASVVLVDSGGGAPRRYPVPELFFIGPWSPDGATIPFSHAGGSSIGLLDVESGRSRTLAIGVPPVRNLRWAPDGTTLIAGANVGTARSPRVVITALAPDGSMRQVFDAGTAVPNARAAFVAEGGGVVVAPPLPVTQLFLRSLDEEQLRAVPLLPAPPGERLLPDQTLQSQWFLSFVQRADLRVTAVDVLTVATGAVRRVPLDAPVKRLPLGILPSGDRFFATRANATDSLPEYFIISGEGETLTPARRLPSGLNISGFLSFSPDGRTLPFVRQGAPTTTLYEVDLTPVLLGRQRE